MTDNTKNKVNKIVKIAYIITTCVIISLLFILFLADVDNSFRPEWLGGKNFGAYVATYPEWNGGAVTYSYDFSLNKIADLLYNRFKLPPYNVKNIDYIINYINFNSNSCSEHFTIACYL